MKRTKKKSTSAMLWISRIFCLLFLTGSLGFVLLNSLENSNVSGTKSREVLLVVNHILEIFEKEPMPYMVLRKMAHFGEFALVGFWISICMRVFTARILLHISFPLFWGLLVAVCDEAVQLYVPGRCSSVIDVMIDFSGILMGTAIAFSICLLLELIFFISKRKARKKEQCEFFYWG